MSEVVRFVPTLATPEVDPDVVAHLRGLLAQAEAGQLRSIAYVYTLPDGSISRGWSIPDDGPSSLDIIAAVAVLQAVLVARTLAGQQ